MIRGAALALVVGVTCGACDSSYKDHCSSDVGTPGVVQCAYDTCTLSAEPCCTGTSGPGGADDTVSKGCPTTGWGQVLPELGCDDATDCQQGWLCCEIINGGTGGNWTMCVPSWTYCATGSLFEGTQSNPHWAGIQLCLASCECHDLSVCIEGTCVDPFVAEPTTCGN